MKTNKGKEKRVLNINLWLVAVAIIASVIGTEYDVLKTQGNLNKHAYNFITCKNLRKQKQKESISSILSDSSNTE